jgi:hypothetical protein
MFINANNLYRKIGGMEDPAFACRERRTAGPSASSGFPVRLGGAGGPHAAFLEESRIRGRWLVRRSRKPGVRSG